MDASHFQELASKDHPPGGKQKVEAGMEAKLQAQIMELTAKIDELTRPRQDGQGREKWNSDDDGLRPNVEASVGGKGPLDRQGASAVQAELGTGATRALITQQAVRPSAGAWEGERVG